MSENSLLPGFATTASTGATSSVEARPARTPAQPTRKAKGSTGRARGSSGSSSESPESCDPLTSWLKTYLGSALEDMTGSTMRWKRSATPSGRSWWVLGTPERRTDATGSGLLPTCRPCSGLRSRGVNQTELERALYLSPTATATANMTAPSMAKWAGHWGDLLPTPAATEYGSDKGGAAGRVGPERPSLRTMLLPTPIKPPERTLHRGYARTEQNGQRGRDLAAMILAEPELLATPTKRDWRSGKASEATHARNARPLSEQAYARGITGTAALLILVEWMMGFPPRWLLDAALAVPASPPTATRSSQRSPRSSAVPSSQLTEADDVDIFA